MEVRGIDLKQPVNQDTIDAIREDVTKCAAASDCFFHAIQPCVAAPADPLSRLLWPLFCGSPLGAASSSTNNLSTGQPPCFLLSDRCAALIAFHRHRLLIFRDQGVVSGDRHVEISNWFGPCESTFYKVRRHLRLPPVGSTHAAAVCSSQRCHAVLNRQQSDCTATLPPPPTLRQHPRSPHPDVFRVSNDRLEGCTGDACYSGTRCMPRAHQRQGAHPRFARACLLHRRSLTLPPGLHMNPLQHCCAASIRLHACICPLRRRGPHRLAHRWQLPDGPLQPRAVPHRVLPQQGRHRWALGAARVACGCHLATHCSLNFFRGNTLHPDLPPCPVLAPLHEAVGSPPAHQTLLQLTHVPLTHSTTAAQCLRRCTRL